MTLVLSSRPTSNCSSSSLKPLSLRWGSNSSGTCTHLPDRETSGRNLPVLMAAMTLTSSFRLPARASREYLVLLRSLSASRGNPEVFWPFLQHLPCSTKTMQLLSRSVPPHWWGALCLRNFEQDLLNRPLPRWVRARAPRRLQNRLVYGARARTHFDLIFGDQGVCSKGPVQNFLDFGNSMTMQELTQPYRRLRCLQLACAPASTQHWRWHERQARPSS